MCYHDDQRNILISVSYERIISKQRKQGEKEETREKEHAVWGHRLKETPYSYISWRGLEDCK